MAVHVSDIEARIRELPDDQLETLLAFIELLATRETAERKSLFVSEAELAEEWLKSEEDEAWADL